MSDFTLTAGVTYNYKKYGAQIRKLSAASTSLSASSTTQKATKIPSSLNFFNSTTTAITTTSSTTTTSNQKKKKKKRPRPISKKKSQKKTPVTASSSDSNSGSSSASDSNSSDADSSDTSSSSDSDQEDDDSSHTAIFRPKKSNASETPEDPMLIRGRQFLEQAANIRAFRKRLKIYVEGNDIADPVTTFEKLYDILPPPPTTGGNDGSHVIDMLLQNIEDSRYKEPTPIQMQAVPCMAEGRDVLAVAPTGSGKTCAFLLPLLISILKKPKKNGKGKKGSTTTHSSAGPRVIVITPTRELAVQILREFKQLSKGKKFKSLVLSKANTGGLSSIKGGGSLQQHQQLAATDFIVSTPMRLVHVITRGALDVSSCQAVVLDEADRLFEDGFIEQIDTILNACRKEKGNSTSSSSTSSTSDKTNATNTFQTAMFSATMPQGIEDMIKSVLVDPVRIRIGAQHAAATGADTIKQRLVFVGREEGKLLAVRQIVQKGLKPPIIMFVQSIARAQALFRELVYDGINVDVIHADRSQAQRDNVVKKFRTGEIWVLIATDLMARGMDFKGVNCVINYDFPQSVISYVHRIGRTGRAGRPGEAITFFTESDMTMLRSIANVMKLSGCDVPDWMLTMKKLRHSDKKRLEKIPVKRMDISTTSNYDKRKRTNIAEAKISSKKAKSQGKEWKSKTDRRRETRLNKKDESGDGGWTVVE